MYSEVSDPLSGLQGNVNTKHKVQSRREQASNDTAGESRLSLALSQSPAAARPFPPQMIFVFVLFCCLFC